MAYQNSYEYQNLKRDLSDVFNQIVKQAPALISLIPTGVNATSTKHEWLEDYVQQLFLTVNGAYTSGGGTVTVDDTTGLKNGDIVSYETQTGLSIATMHVVSNITATTFDIVAYGGFADSNIPDNAIVKIVNRPRNEGTSAIFTEGQEPVVEFNYTEIIDEAARITKTAEAVQVYGLTERKLDYQVEVALKRMMWRLNNAVIHGRRVQRTSVVAGTMGGILQFVSAGTENVIDNLGVAITYDVLNEAITQGISLGATGLNTIVCHPKQAMRISTFNNSIVQTQRTDSITGSQVVSVLNGLGQIANVVTDFNFPKDKILIVDTTKLALSYLRNPEDSDATTSPADDYFARRILMELTLEVKNAKNCHVLINNVLP